VLACSRVSRGSSVSIVGVLRAGQHGSRTGKGKAKFRSALRHIPSPTQGAQKAPQGLKPPGRETDHSPLNSTTDKDTWIYIPTPPYAFMMWRLIS
jgi:hypothetical protein